MRQIDARWVGNPASTRGRLCLAPEDWRSLQRFYRGHNLGVERFARVARDGV
jgi:hypothetical protein